jgi:hypothetical protein
MAKRRGAIFASVDNTVPVTSIIIPAGDRGVSPSLCPGAGPSHSTGPEAESHRQRLEGRHHYRPDQRTGCGRSAGHGHPQRRECRIPPGDQTGVACGPGRASAIGQSIEGSRLDPPCAFDSVVVITEGWLAGSTPRVAEGTRLRHDDPARTRVIALRVGRVEVGSEVGPAPIPASGGNRGESGGSSPGASPNTTPTRSERAAFPTSGILAILGSLPTAIPDHPKTVRASLAFAPSCVSLQCGRLYAARSLAIRLKDLPEPQRQG